MIDILRKALTDANFYIAVIAVLATVFVPILYQRRRGIVLATGRERLLAEQPPPPGALLRTSVTLTILLRPYGTISGASYVLLAALWGF